MFNLLMSGNDEWWDRSPANMGRDQPNIGRTLYAKFIERAEQAAYAVVIMTPDDIGGLAGTPTDRLRPRARQNVIFELGFFVGKLGPNRVCALLAGDVEKPSDFEAVVYISYGANTNWRNDLARELRAASIDFDHSKVF